MTIFSSSKSMGYLKNYIKGVTMVVVVVASMTIVAKTIAELNPTFALLLLYASYALYQKKPLASVLPFLVASMPDTKTTSLSTHTYL